MRYDLTVPRNRRRLMRLLSSRLVLVVCRATPCTTFSIAREPLRRSDDPTLPREGLSEKPLALFHIGKLLADVCACCNSKF